MDLGTFLADWTDIDVAQHALAVVLGIMPAGSEMADAKGFYWSKNPLGDELLELLDRLARLGYLEKREEPDFQYRVNADFKRHLQVQSIWSRV